MGLDGKVVIITGASSPRGKAIAIKFATLGAYVVLVGKNENKLNSVKGICDAKIDDDGKPALVIQADLTDDDEVRNVVDQTIARYRKINILINNAEVVGKGRLHDRSVLQTFDDVMNINVRAVVSLTNYAAPYLIQTKGNIVNISSVGAERILANNYIPYFVSKAALNNFTKACAMDLGKRDVRVNTVSVGADSISLHYSQCIEQHTNVEDIANLVVFVASSKSRNMTGSNVVCDNGNLAAYVSPLTR